MPFRSHWFLPLALLAGSACAGVARADGGDHDRARTAVRAGDVMPLSALLARLERSHPGKVLEVELERERGVWLYEIKLLQADGQLLKLKLDARSGEPLRPPPKADPARDKR